jgi:hypothetical protein
MIQADLKKSQLGDSKIIRISRDSALLFIQQYCSNRIERVGERLHYDGIYLYLLAGKQSTIANIGLKYEN